MEINVGIVGIGIYIPEKRITAKEISDRTKGKWSETAIIEKLGIKEKPIPGEDDGTQEMGVKAALDCIKNTNINPKDIDVILCFGEEWKEYPLTTSALYIQDKIGAENAWGIDLQNRCCTTISAMKIAKDMLIADKDIYNILIVGGYRNGDLIDFSDSDVSMFYDLSAGGGAILLRKNYGKNLLLGTHIKGDGSFSRSALVEIGGINNPFNIENVKDGYGKFKIPDPEKLKNKLKEVSAKNWLICLDLALKRSELKLEDIGFLDILHVKPSSHREILDKLKLREDQSIYLENYGHIGQVDQILSLSLALKEGKVKDGTIICMLAAGIGYVWAANIIRWG